MKPIKLYKGHLLLYIILAICTVVAMISMKQCRTEINPLKSYQRAEGDTINVAIEISPISYSLATDTAGGFYYDLLRLISSKYNVKFKYHKFVSLNTAINGLNDQIFDIIVGDFPSTTDIKENFLHTEPVLVDKQVLVQRKGENVLTDYLQLSNDTIFVVEKSPFINRIHNLSREVGCDTIYVAEQNYSSEQLIMLTATGDIKQCVVNEYLAKSMIKDYPQLDIKTKISFNQFQSWILSPHNADLCDRFNKWIIDIKNSVEYNELYKRYFQSKEYKKRATLNRE